MEEAIATPGRAGSSGNPAPEAVYRFIICLNPDQAVRDAAVREKMISQLEELIDGSDQLA